MQKSYAKIVSKSIRNIFKQTLSVRTLQRLRESERVGYAIFRGACRYRLSEIERLVSESDFIINAQNLEAFQRNLHLHTRQVKRKSNNKD